jgi:ATP-dependent RNA helicase DDX46/PRP5
MQEQRLKAQQIAIQAASRLAAMTNTRQVESVGGGIRRVVPSGSERVSNSDKQAALIMAAQSSASRIATSVGMRQNVAQAAKLQTMQIAAARAVKLAQPTEYYESELVINDFPQSARFHVTHRDTLAQISERTGAARRRASC